MSTRIATVTLAVRDLDRVASFYQAAIGLSPIATEPGALLLGVGGRPFLRLEHRPTFRPVDPASAGLFHTAFLLPTRADLGRWLRHAAQNGHDLDGAADHLVSEAVYLHDPEGNGIEIYADRPAAGWTWEDGAVVMANERLDIDGLVALAEEPWQAAPPGTRIGHVHLQVGAVDVAERFYAGQLGFAVTRRWPKAAFLATGGYHHQLAVNTWRSQGAGPRDPDRAGLASITLTGPARSPMTDPWGTTILFDGETA